MALQSERRSPASPLADEPAAARPALTPGQRGRLSWERNGDGYVTSVARRDTYRIVVRSGALGDLGELLGEVAGRLDARSVLVVTDSVVADLHLEPTLRALQALGLPVRVISIPAGERSKSVERLLVLWQELLHGEIERRTLVVSLGGGVICDLVGFAAATYMRGLPYVNVPTSLLAQVDAAIGGKVAVDDPHAKNLLGAFHHPAMVVVDPAILGTLPAAEIANGLAEVVKVAVIASGSLMDALERGEHGAASGMEAVVREAIEIKLALLAADPFEVDLRRALNLGHCVGHPLEVASRYGMRHGEAVAVGLVVAGEIARLRGLCVPATVDRIRDVLKRLGLSTVFPAHLADAVWDRMAIIRQVRNGELNLVVPEAIGRCAILPAIHDAEYREAVRATARH